MSLLEWFTKAELEIRVSLAYIWRRFSSSNHWSTIRLAACDNAISFFNNLICNLHQKISRQLRTEETEDSPYSDLRGKAQEKYRILCKAVKLRGSSTEPCT